MFIPQSIVAIRGIGWLALAAIAVALFVDIGRYAVVPVETGILLCDFQAYRGGDLVAFASSVLPRLPREPPVQDRGQACNI